MSITSINPKTSRISGGVYFDLYGQDLLGTEYKHIVSDSVYQDRSYGGSTVVDEADGAILYVPATTNTEAKVKLDKIFGRAFDIEVSFEKRIKSLPSIDKARFLQFIVENRNDLTQYTCSGLEYIDEKGHIGFIENYDSSGLVSREEISINPHNVLSLRLVNAGRYIHGFLVMNDGSRIRIGNTEELEYLSSNVLIGLKAPVNGYAREFDLKLLEVKLSTMVSLAGYPADIITVDNNHVYGKTLPAEITIGDVILSRNDGIVYSIDDGFRYVVGSGVARLVKSFDTVQAVYAEATDPLRQNLFSQAEGLQWDRDYFLSKTDRNDNLFVPSLWDPTTGNVPQTFFQSGIGTGDGLEFKKIAKQVAEDVESWYAYMRHGTYFVNNVPYYLFSDESVVSYLSEEKTEDGRSVIFLEYPPKPGIPIVASSLSEDIATKKIIDRFRLTKKGRFTGRVQNGVELDAMADPSLIDETQTEFVVIYNSNNKVNNWLIETLSVEDLGNGTYLYIIELPEAPLENFPLIFSRPDIFFTEKTIANKYDAGIYSAFKYGEGIQLNGEFAIDHQNSQVQVITDREYLDFGTVSYEFDYPARLEFNNVYVKDHGSTITNPTYETLRELDDIGLSTGDPGQAKRLSSFPIIDYTTSLALDLDNFKLFIYNEYDNSFDKEWVRVRDITRYGPTEKVYELSPENGLVKFGNGVNGLIPTKYTKILAGYKESLKIQYEPSSANSEWIGKTLDLNLGKSSLNAGFLYLSRKKLTPAFVSIEFGNKEVLSYEQTDLRALVYTQERDLVSDVEIKFEIIQGGGSILDPVMETDANGEANTIFTPSSRIEDMGIRIDLFNPGTDPDTKGEVIPNTYQSEAGVAYRVLSSQEPVDGELDKMYLFRILDDNDPFLSYNNTTRKGGRFVALFQDTLGGRELIRPNYIAGNALGFDVQLPQPYDEFGPNYDADLRGFYIVGKKTIAVRAYVDVDDVRIYSDIIRLKVEYSELQTGEWTLPIPPTVYRSSQIDTATYIDLDS